MKRFFSKKASIHPARLTFSQELINESLSKLKTAMDKRKEISYFQYTKFDESIFEYLKKKAVKKAPVDEQAFFNSNINQFIILINDLREFEKEIKNLTLSPSLLTSDVPAVKVAANSLKDSCNKFCEETADFILHSLKDKDFNFHIRHTNTAELLSNAVQSMKKLFISPDIDTVDDLATTLRVITFKTDSALQLAGKERGLMKTLSAAVTVMKKVLGTILSLVPPLAPIGLLMLKINSSHSKTAKETSLAKLQFYTQVVHNKLPQSGTPEAEETNSALASAFKSNAAPTLTSQEPSHHRSIAKKR